MKNLMRHRGFYGSVLYDDRRQTLHGRVEGIREKITYEANDVKALKKRFESAVDEYLSTHTPRPRHNGTFNIRIGAELHQKAALKAKQKRMNLNQLIKAAVAEYLNVA